MVERTKAAEGERGRFRVRVAAQAAYWALAWAFVVCVGVQVFLAGMAVFVDALNWVRHVNFVHYFELVPALMVVLAFVAGMPRGEGLYLRPVILLFLTGMQYYFAGSGRTPLAALHPVNALVIFWLAMTHATAVWPRWPVRRGAERS